MKGYALCAACVAAATLACGPASAQDVQARDGVERHRAAFAGATVRLELGGPRVRRAPQARLGIGFSDYRRDSAGFISPGGGPRLPLQAGLADGRVQWFVGGERASRLDRRLGAGSTKKTLLVIGGIAVGAAAALLLLDGDGDDGPCPPGVEVCAQ